MESPDWDVSTTSVVILGAGFSAAATDGGMPLMGSFFDRLEKSASPLLHEFVCSVACDVKKANVESVLVHLDQVRTSPRAVLKGWAENWKTNLPQLQRELETYVLGRIKSGLAVAPDNWATSLLAECGSATTVISMNYDNIAERVLSYRAHKMTPRRSCPHCKMCALLRKSCNCISRQEMTERDWRGALVKPHGSIAWKRCTNADCCNCGCLVADAHCQPFEPCCCDHCSTKCSPAIVMPTMSKNLDDLPEISVMWQAARNAIADAETILIFGFSMPTSDELLMQMIRSTLHANQKLKRVAVIDLDPDGVLSRFERCLPDGVPIEPTLFKVVPGERPTWLRPRTEACS